MKNDEKKEVLYYLIGIIACALGSILVMVINLPSLLVVLAPATLFCIIKYIRASKEARIDAASREKTFYKFAAAGRINQVTLFDVDIFDYTWAETGRTATVVEPRYGKRFTFPVYYVNIGGEKKEFAAGEIRNNVYGFFI